MMERKSLMKCLIFGLIASSVCYDAAAIKVEGGAYQNIVIEIQKDVPHNNCLDLLNSLQVSLDIWVMHEWTNPIDRYVSFFFYIKHGSALTSIFFCELYFVAALFAYFLINWNLTEIQHARNLHDFHVVFSIQPIWSVSNNIFTENK